MNDSPHLGEPLRLPYQKRPAPGETVELAPGLLWAAMPLPFRLNHVNIWLLDDGDGWTAVDCGPDTADVRAAWHTIEGRLFEGKPLRRLVATHGHVDHVGLSGDRVEKYDAAYDITLPCWLWSRKMSADAYQPTSVHATRFLSRHGVAEDVVARYANDRGPHAKLYGSQPDFFNRIQDGDTLTFGGRRWQVILGSGHADDHASFYCAEDRILIAGDQILQRISPVVGVFASEPEGDPLSQYLASLDRFGGLHPDCLVLPSHGLPFYGLERRTSDLVEHHHQRLDMASDAIAEPATGYEVAHVLFERAMREGQWFLATAETLAHLHRLETEGRAERIEERGTLRFRRV